MAQKDTEYLESKEPFRNVQLIGGAYAKVDTHSIVGYCHNNDHKGFLTISIMNEHECIQKKCHYFEKFLDYPFWQKRQRKEQLRQLEKEKANRRKENQKLAQKNLERKNSTLLSQANELISKFGYENIKIISIHTDKNSGVIFYISDKNENDWYEYRELAFSMSRIFNKKFILKHAKLPDGSFATMQLSNK